MDITDVRKALWKLYRNNEGWEGKSGEAYVSVNYPAYWDCHNEAEFLEPSCIVIYSYAFGPSREHYIERSDKDSHPNYYTWTSPDIYKKAVDVIEGWRRDYYLDDVRR